MRHKIIAGNWKMNLDLNQGKALLSEILDSNINKDTLTIIAPPAIHLNSFNQMLSHTSIALAAQNCHQQDSGAYTGELSVGMLKSVGVEYVIIGHSERREYFNEDDLILKEKVDKALQESMEVIFCFGEQFDDRNSENHFKVVKSQIKNALFHLPSSSWKSVILAYEPVWAIGTGQTASPEQAQEMHAFIRNLVEEGFGAEIAENVAILYGGSVKPANAQEIFSKSDVDGGLIGGAALNADDFFAIVQSI